MLVALVALLVSLPVQNEAGVFPAPPDGPVDDERAPPGPADAARADPGDAHRLEEEALGTEPLAGLHAYDRFGWKHQLQLAVLGKVGISAGHYWTVVVPPAPSPGVGVRVMYTIRLLPSWRVRAEAKLVVGGSDEGSYNYFGSYTAKAGIGHRWFDLGWLRMWTDLEKGVDSYYYVPVPTIGLGTDLIFLPLGLLPQDGTWAAVQEWVYWDITLGLDVNALVIVPGISPALSTLVLFRWARWSIGFEIVIDGELRVAVAANSIAAGAQARAVTGWDF